MNFANCNLRQPVEGDMVYMSIPCDPGSPPRHTPLHHWRADWPARVAGEAATAPPWALMAIGQAWNTAATIHLNHHGGGGGGDDDNNNTENNIDYDDGDDDDDNNNAENYRLWWWRWWW